MAISLIAALSSTPVLAHSLTVMPRSQTQVATLSAEIVLTVFLFCPKATRPPPPPLLPASSHKAVYPVP